MTKPALQKSIAWVRQASREPDIQEAAKAFTGSKSPISFGPFRVFPERRLLFNKENQVRLGSRAAEILVALIERPGELVTRDELMRRVWPNMVVDEANLKVQISALRRALGDGQAGRRYVATIPGRGYRLVAPVSIVGEAEAIFEQVAARARPHNLPAQLTRLVGRQETVERLTELLRRNRLLSLVGPGGIGKTSVALVLAETLASDYQHGAWLVDLAPLADPELVAVALAETLGLDVRSETPIPALIAALRDKQILLLLDNCEHVVAAAASLANAILQGVPAARIVATSREPLRCRGEHVYRLPPLAIPPTPSAITAVEALSYPAAELFVERAGAILDSFKLSDCEAPLVAKICASLDGIPLAIEFAAARVDTLGICGIASRIEDRLHLLNVGRRTALPRHRTMSATLDWSYGLLNEVEQRVLRRLAVFTGRFTLQAAHAVVADWGECEDDIGDLVLGLAAKSLVIVDSRGSEPQLQLLETTRAYALSKLDESGEREKLVRRHAEYHRGLGAAAGHIPLRGNGRQCRSDLEGHQFRSSGWASLVRDDAPVSEGT